MNEELDDKKIRLLIRVYGIVQGVGFRPFVSRIAMATKIAGSVCNKGPYVEIFAEGSTYQVEDFLFKLTHEAPERSSILKVEKQNVEVKNETDFKIIQSEKVKGDIFVSPDIAICSKCKAELFDKNDRRYLHPFINCTACGPRLTILDSMPYDRVRTSMGEFPMCPECEYEYTHAETRRYHAQPVCCNKCGPELYLVGRSEKNKDALLYTRKIIREGGIAAVKGIGGFHLCCDATNSFAVARLRKLKNRPFKPFAVMMRDMETVKRECYVLENQESFIEGPQKPILLLERKNSCGTKLCEEVAPENPSVGVMLPYAPVQLLLFTYPNDEEMSDCFVMTSGNPRGAPICHSDEEAVAYLSTMCDVILSNNRKIRLRADDSVMSWQNGKPYMIRRSRGYAPLPFMLSGKNKVAVLAVGGELKNTFCLSNGNLFYPSPYIGDLADVRSVEALSEAVKRMETLLEIKPSVVACDMHPKYNSTVFAHELGLPVIEVQHHFAHIASCMAENDFTGDEVIGVSFDGTGYGTDGTIWGGEFMRASYKTFTRLGSVMPFAQAGGDSSSKDGWRIAVSLLPDEKVRKLNLCNEQMLSFESTMISRKINTVTSTSCGRLFDSVSAILGYKTSSTFEGEASMALEFAAEREWKMICGAEENAFEKIDSIIEATVPELKSLELISEEKGNDGRFLLNTTDLVNKIAEAVLRGVESDKLALVFHKILADMILAGCKKCKEETNINTVALSGGVFQNLLLVDMCRRNLEKNNFTVLTHSLVPSNDGGIALGQAVVAEYNYQFE